MSTQLRPIAMMVTAYDRLPHHRTTVCRATVRRYQAKGTTEAGFQQFRTTSQNYFSYDVQVDQVTRLARLPPVARPPRHPPCHQAAHPATRPLSPIVQALARERA